MNRELNTAIGEKFKNELIDNAIAEVMFRTTKDEFLVKGFTMDDDLLKEILYLGQDYFDELLERLRDIRALEKSFYKIADIYTTSTDDAEDPTSNVYA